MKFFLLIIGFWFVSATAVAQDVTSELAASPDDLESSAGDAHEFILLRGKYKNYPLAGWGSYGYRRRNGREWWSTDYPDADQNLLRGVQRLTNIDVVSTGYRAIALTDPEMFEYSVMYINMKRIPLYAGNGPNFSPEEAAALREYLLRGGFVIFDDFWGPEHWEDFVQEIAKVFPDRSLFKLNTDHPLVHCFFDIDTIAQIPGRGVTWNFGSGFYLDDPEYPTAVHAITDDDGRLMLIANFNTDLGDGWEHTFDPAYPTIYCNEAYKLGINFIIYALSH